MAFSKGKESTGSNGSSFVKHIGIGMFEIAAINPNEKEYEQLYGRAPQNELVYVKERDGHKVANIRVYLRNVTGGATSNFIVPVNFFLEDAIKKGKDSGKIKVIDKYGNCRWISQENYDSKTVPTDKNGNKIVLDQEFRQCFGDEDLLIKMLRAYLVLDRPDEYVNGLWVFKSKDQLANIESSLEHVKDCFSGNFSELKDIVALQPNNKFKALLGIRSAEDGKEYQDVFRHHFMQYWEENTKQLEYQLGQNKEYSYPNTKFELCPLKEYLSDVKPTDFNSTSTQTELPVMEQDDDLPF